jgi:hypothetical protein
MHLHACQPHQRAGGQSAAPSPAFRGGAVGGVPFSRGGAPRPGLLEWFKRRYIHAFRARLGPIAAAGAFAACSKRAASHAQHAREGRSQTLNAAGMALRRARAAACAAVVLLALAAGARAGNALPHGIVLSTDSTQLCAATLQDCQQQCAAEGSFLFQVRPREAPRPPRAHATWSRRRLGRCRCKPLPTPRGSAAPPCPLPHSATRAARLAAPPACASAYRWRPA